MDKENAKALTIPQLNRWFDITNLRTPFLAISLSNSKPTSRETNNKPFFKKQTGHWPLTKAALDHGIEGRNIVLFYSDKGAATVYISTCVSERETGHTKDGKPRYTFPAARQWEGEEHTEVFFSRFFEGVLMSSNPTVLWADMNSYASPRGEEIDRERTDDQEDQQDGEGGYDVPGYLDTAIATAFTAYRSITLNGLEASGPSSGSATNGVHAVGTLKGVASAMSALRSGAKVLS